MINSCGFLSIKCTQFHEICKLETTKGQLNIDTKVEVPPNRLAPNQFFPFNRTPILTHSYAVRNPLRHENFSSLPCTNDQLIAWNIKKETWERCHISIWKMVGWMQQVWKETEKSMKFENISTTNYSWYWQWRHITHEKNVDI